jgi:muramoyltetrapeptide carboxypeptidase
MVATEFGQGLCLECVELLWRLISRPEPAGDLFCPHVAALRQSLVAGTVEGVLMGGTLCLVESSIGTSYAIDTAGKILVLEDSHETAWRVDRMLTHLAHAGVLDGAAGFVIGSLVEGPNDPDELSLPIGQSLLDHLGPLGRPVLCGLPFGHIDAPLTLPLGCRARVDAEAGTIRVLEPAVCSRSGRS